MNKREIKFRVWDNANNRYYVPSAFISMWPVLQMDGSVGMAGEFAEYQYAEELTQSRFIVQLYTGFKNKNDKEIYEGDRVKLYNIDGKFLYIGEITWVQKEGGWMIIEITDNLLKQECSLCDFMAESCEVMNGN